LRQQSSNLNISTYVEHKDYKLNSDKHAELINQIRAIVSQINTLASKMTALENKISELMEYFNQLKIKNLELEYNALQGKLINYVKYYIFSEFQSNPASQSTSIQRNEIRDCCCCIESKATYAFISCGHVCLCGKCYKHWQKLLNTPLSLISESDRQFKTCPICKQSPNGLLKLFF
jgi:hypothetical protein